MADHEDEHAAYAAARLGVGDGSNDSGYVYVSANPQHEEALDLFVDGDDSVPPLAVVGEKRSGKTALLCNWLARRAELRPGRRDFFFAHFVGCAPRSLYLRTMLHRLQSALKNQFDLREMDVPKPEERLRWGLSRFLAAADGRRSDPTAKIIIVIDGANDLVNENTERGKLHWLPTTLPGSVRFVLSTTEYDEECHSRSQCCTNRRHRTFTELTRRQCLMVRLSSLAPETRQGIVDAFVRKYPPCLALGETQREKLASVELSSQPTYLRLLLSALRLELDIGNSVEMWLDRYLKADSTDRLLAIILSRWVSWVEPELVEENDCSTRGSALIFIFCAIQASRSGLSTDEMWGLVEFKLEKSLTATQKERIVRILVDHCIIVNGLYLFSHSIVKETLFSFFIESPSSNIHDTMAQFFGEILRSSARESSNKGAVLSSPSKSLSSPCAKVAVDSDRPLSCIVWHLEVAGMWTRLHEVLVDMRYFHLWCQQDEFINLWASLISSCQQCSESDVSLVTGPFCHRTMQFHQTLRPVFDPVEEYTKSLDTFRTKHGMSDASLRKTVILIAVFLLELSVRGHEEQANVPAFHHPHLGMNEMADLGVPHIDHEEHAFITPKLHGTEDAEEKEDRVPINIDHRSPVRSTYFFHRFVWIHYPIMALEDRDELIKVIRRSHEAREAADSSSEEKAKRHYVSPNKTETLPSDKTTGVQKRPRTTAYPSRSKRNDSANDDMALLNQLKTEYDTLVQRRLKRLHIKDRVCTELACRENENHAEKISKKKELKTRQNNVVVERETEDELHDNYTCILKSCLRNPAHVPSLVSELETNLQEASDLILLTKEAIASAKYETTSAKTQFNHIEKAQQDAQVLYTTMISHRQKQKDQIHVMVQDEEQLFETMSKAVDAAGNLSPEVKIPRPSSRRGKELNGVVSGADSTDDTGAAVEGKSDHLSSKVDEIKDRTGIGNMSEFASRIADACGEVRDHIDAIRSSSEDRISALKAELDRIGEEHKRVLAAVDAAAATEDINEERSSLSAEIKELEGTTFALDEKNDVSEALLLSVRDGVESVACSLGLPKLRSADCEGVLGVLEQVDDLIMILAQEGQSADEGASNPSKAGTNKPSDRLGAAINAYSANRQEISSRRSAGPLNEPPCSRHKEREEIAEAMRGHRKHIKSGSEQVVRAEQARAAKERAKKERQELEG